MAAKLHKDGGHYKIEWHDDADAVVHYWTEFSSGEAFKEGSNELLEFVRSKDASKMIVDTSGIRAHDEEDKQWLLNEWIPKISEAGVEHSAVVHPDSVISEMEMEDFAQDLEGLVQYNTSSMDEAKDWLADK